MKCIDGDCMAITLYYTNYGTLKFYPARNGEKMVPYYDDINTRDALVGGRGGSLHQLLQSINPHATSKLYLPGRDGHLHKVGLYTEGRVMINTFGKPDLPSFVGSSQEYSPDIVGVSLYLKGMSQSRENVLWELGLDPKIQWESAYYQDPVYGEKRQKEAIKKGGREIKKSAPVPQNQRTESIEKTEERKKHSYEMNQNVIQEGIQTGSVLFSYTKNEKMYIPARVIEALSLRGIDYEQLSTNTLLKLGFCTSITPFTNELEHYKRPVTGFLARLDNSSYQIRVCDIEDGQISFVGKDRHLRFVTLGPAMTFLVEDALRSAERGERRPLVLSEGMFDALSVEVASRQAVYSASLQGCKNHKYISELSSRLVQAKIPIIIAFDSDASGKATAIELMRELLEKGVHVYRWPGALLEGKDMNDLVSTDLNAAKTLMSIISRTVNLAEDGKLNGKMVNAVLGYKVVDEKKTGIEVVQPFFDCLRAEASTSNIQDFGSRFQSIKLHTKDEKLRVGYTRER